MSTNYYLTCNNHQPPLQSDTAAQNAYGLGQLTDILANRDAIVIAWRVLEFATVGNWCHENAVRFLADHPDCSIGIVDEYGRAHPAREEDDDGPQDPR